MRRPTICPHCPIPVAFDRSRLVALDSNCDWAREKRRLCDAVLDRELFMVGGEEARGYGAGASPSPEVRAANAAALYRWAVRH
ncbi:hypothetical protein [Streptomyces sp. NPDC088554]|uniref:hypothetical protein n=1 Tax=Streptomyces sp. NPDC088554 TaxID=3365865 RepID=UPI0038108ABD